MIYYGIIFLVGIILQFGWSQFLSFAGLVPNVIIILLMFVGLTCGPVPAQVLGFLWGLSWDALSLDLFGTHALLFTILGYLSGQLSHKWNEGKVINQMALTLFANSFFWVGTFVIYQVFAPGEFKFKVNYIMVVQPFYTMLVAPVLFKIGEEFMIYAQRNGSLD
ncbi:MAG: rod shape-determining protein MreD [Elusimicrobia bacterium RIFOXYA2_FULL_50_26]|nr:MAG: rod shape-determining protein MreD [Elusimicrobia bacterium RIFOXYA2_FULL_50_26]OGS25115.1 MAG: rod shape-determining protein MreD [Elusimicrobia bacterium RIFOXYB2_FULL_50_12]